MDAMHEKRLVPGTTATLPSGHVALLEPLTQQARLSITSPVYERITTACACAVYVPGSAARVELQEGEIAWRTVVTVSMVKLLAFVDASRGTDPAPPRGDALFAAVPCAAGITDTNDLMRWFTSRLVLQDSGIGSLQTLLRGTEAYQLIRFLLAADASVSVEQLGTSYGLSPSHFRRKCQVALGRSLKHELRLLRAARSLLDSARLPRSFTRVAEDYGFASSAHFSSDIKSLLGVCPRDIYSRNICGH